MPEYAQQEINEIRRQAKAKVSSEANSDKEGISRETVLSFMNAGEQALVARLLEECPQLTLFDTPSTIQLVALQREYALPGDAFAGGDVKRVEYSRDGQEKSYVTLRPMSPFEMPRCQSYTPRYWQLRGEMLELAPTPQNGVGTVRVTYSRAPDKIDVRRGKVASVTKDVPQTNYLTLTLENDSNLEETLFDYNTFLCVNTAGGTVERYNLEYTSYSTTTKTFTLAASQAVADGAITVGSYVTVGQYSTTHSKLPRMCDAYRIAYTVLRMQAMTSNTDFNEEHPLLKDIETTLIEKLSTRAHGPQRIPVTNNMWR